MGESCEEGEPFPSRKIPQRKELDWSAQNKLLFIYQKSTYYKELHFFSVQKDQPPAVSNYPSNADVSSF